MRKSGLPPVVDVNTKVLILGTLPSDQSHAVRQYYADPRNDFWKLIGAVLDRSFDGLAYTDKLALLRANGIGLWDAYHSCIRPGSMDANITEAELNDSSVLRELAPKLKLVCFNGHGAASAEESLARLGYQTCLLPSSSGTNRRDEEGRELRWKTAIRPR
jgi:hypoxanthine-DNA glycosylase